MDVTLKVSKPTKFSDTVMTFYNNNNYIFALVTARKQFPNLDDLLLLKLMQLQSE